MENEILIIDLETTGFNLTDFIVEIGLVSLNILTGEIKPLINEVTWEKGITKEVCEKSWIVKNSTLSPEDIRLGNNFSKIKSLIQTIINHYPLCITAYNNKFDFKFLKDRGIKLHKYLPCPMEILTPIMKIPHKTKQGYKWPSVEEAYKFFFPNEEYKELHRGLDDAIHEARIIFELIKIEEFKV